MKFIKSTKSENNCETMNKVPINVEIIVSGLINEHINTICIKYKILMKLQDEDFQTQYLINCPCPLLLVYIYNGYRHGCNLKKKNVTSMAYRKRQQ